MSTNKNKNKNNLFAFLIKLQLFKIIESHFCPSAMFDFVHRVAPQLIFPKIIKKKTHRNSKPQA